MNDEGNWSKQVSLKRTHPVWGSGIIEDTSYLLYRQECFTGKYTARKIHTKLHPGPEWRFFHILTSEYVDDVISRSFTAVRCKQSVKNGERYICLYNKKKITRWLKDMNFIFEWSKQYITNERISSRRRVISSIYWP